MPRDVPIPKHSMYAVYAYIRMVLEVNVGMECLGHREKNKYNQDEPLGSLEYSPDSCAATKTSLPSSRVTCHLTCIDLGPKALTTLNL